MGAATKSYARSLIHLQPGQDFESVYSQEYVPYQTGVHRKLDELKYVVAYGRPDDSEEMKTSKTAGCVDWVYINGLESEFDEEVIPSKRSDDPTRYASDHNAVKVTLVI